MFPELCLIVTCIFELAASAPHRTRVWGTYTSQRARVLVVNFHAGAAKRLSVSMEDACF